MQIVAYQERVAALIFSSVLYCPSAYTAQIAAGSHPSTVTCKIKQTMPAIGLPIVKKVTKGKKMASSNRIVCSVSGSISKKAFYPMAVVNLALLYASRTAWIDK